MINLNIVMYTAAPNNYALNLKEYLQKFLWNKTEVLAIMLKNQ